MSGRNRYGSYFVLQTRKRDVSLYFTTQSIWQVDIRIRENLDRLISCKNYAANSFEYEIIDYRYDPPVKKKIMLNGSLIYNLYDTSEIIDPMRTPAKKKDTRKNHHKIIREDEEQE
jgi:hypothetical protein